MTYDAFISYSHAADGRLAPALQSGLQRMAKPWYRLRVLRVFRDETGLSTNPHLWESIETALDESEWFVLLASPDAATSPWVDKEIADWLETKPAHRVLPASTGGEWEWDPVARRLAGDAVPDRLAAAITEEPRHLDLRWAAGETDLDLRNSRFRSAVADLAAPMHGIAKDELEGEDIRQHRRARRLARAGVATVVGLLIVAVIFGGYAVNQRNQATRQRNEAQAATATAQHQLLVSQSQAHLAADRQLATLLALEADARRPGADTRDALLNAVVAEPLLQRTFAGPALLIGALVGHRVALLRTDRGAAPNRDIVQVWDWQTGRREPWPDAPLGDATSGPVGVATTSDGLLLAVAFRDGMIQMYSGRTLEPQGAAFSSGLDRLAGPVSSVAFSADGRALAVTTGSPQSSEREARPSISVFSRRGNGWMLNPHPRGNRTRVTAFDLSADGTMIATASLSPAGDPAAGSDIAISAVATGQTVRALRTVPTSFVALDWTRRRVVVSSQTTGNGDAVWYDLNSGTSTPHVISRGLSPGGYAVIGYDARHLRLGIFGSDRFGIFDAATLTALPNTPVLRPNNSGSAFLFLDADHVLLATPVAGPLSVWDLTSSSVLATPSPPQYYGGIIPTGDPQRHLAFSAFGLRTTVTVLDGADRPLGAPIPDAFVACLDPRTGRFATIGLVTGDVVIRDGTPPFPVLRRTSGATRGIADPARCAWRPDGRQIAIGTYRQFRPAGPISVALYDVASGTIRSEPLPGQIAVSAVFYSADSKTLFAGGPTRTANGVYEITDLDRRPRVGVAFPGATGIGVDAAGRRLIVAFGASIRVFDAVTRRPLAPPIPLPGAYIYDVSAVGRTAVVASVQGFRLVDLDAQQPTGPMLPMRAVGLAVVASDATTVYVSTSTAGGVGWNVAPADVRAVVCDLAGRNLTEQEWARDLSWAGPRRATCAEFPLG